MRLLHSVIILVCAIASLFATPRQEKKSFRSVDGLYSLQMSLPYAVEEYDGDEPNRRYGISDKRGRLLVWFHFLSGCNSTKAVDLLMNRQAPIEFRPKPGEQFSRKTVRLGGQNLVRLIDPTGRYVVHVVETDKGTWILGTWTLRWSQERMRMDYVHEFISTVRPQ